MSLLQHVWLHQRRFLQLGKCTLEEPSIVTTSLPQGDPAGPLGLLLVLGDAIADISASKINQAVRPTVRALLSAHPGNVGVLGLVWLRIPTRLWLLLKCTISELHLYGQVLILNRSETNPALVGQSYPSFQSESHFL